MNSKLIFFILLLLSPNAMGFYEMRLTANDEGVTIHDKIVRLSLINNGDEKANRLLLSIDTPAGIQTNIQKTPHLYPNKEFSGHFKLNVSSGLTNGTYSSPIHLDFLDGKGYPISMIFPFSINLGVQATGQVNPIPSSFDIPEESSIPVRVEVVNYDDTERTVTVQAYAPNSMGLEGLPKGLTIPGRSKTNVSFYLINQQALPGSTLNLLVSCEYLDSGIHYSRISTIKAHVIKKSMLDSVKKNPIIPTVLLMTAVILGLRFYQSRKPING